ncbi:MAG: response regulator [Myxococcota bacterium]
MSQVRSVLIVDDNPADVEIAKLLLSESGCYGEIYSVSDGREAFELFNGESAVDGLGTAFPPTLILLDLNMPRMNGFEFLEAYSTLDREGEPPVVVVLSSSSAVEDRERIEVHDVVHGFLTKPITIPAAIELASQLNATNG